MAEHIFADEGAVSPRLDGCTVFPFEEEAVARPHAVCRRSAPRLCSSPPRSYDPALHATTKPGGEADSTVSARYTVGLMLGEATQGRFGGLAVFNRALTDAEMKALHDAANIAAVE